MHSHHTVPQCRGGKDSIQVILCATCHNTLHAHALHETARIKNSGKTKEKVFWPNERQRIRALPLVRLIVEAFLTPIDQLGVPLTHLVSTSLPTEEFQLFKILAQELGSQEKALRFCIQHTLLQKGLVRETHKNPELWFLPTSGTRKGIR